ncbi:MAG TPA: filamentous hemagglutinin N-terminal domain-containing protein, partial [Mycobacterium sp.]|uniref:two-partner secretion domain-containing protein n=1 Tax=Mycobacterium sp. TaxID=1785 RepID=UPI002F41B44E
MNKHASINRAFRLIWSDALSAWIPVAEIARGRGKGSGRRAAALAVLAAAGWSPALHAAPPAHTVAVAAPAPNALPTGGTVAAGAATITTPGQAVLDIGQTSQRAVIDWNTFNVGSAAQVNFNQPNSSSATLNRVLDSNASQIFGKITAIGQVFLSNPNGVYFGKSASVDVGSLTATTGSIDNAAFMAGQMTFARDGATGSIVNDGALHAALGGYIALLAPSVRNSGVIIAHMGTVAISAGDSVTLNFDGGHLAGITTHPATVAALLADKSAVLAPGGIVILSAPALDRLQGSVVKAPAAAEATHLANNNGRIVLETGTVQQTATGSIDVSGSSGGHVAINGARDVALAGSIDASATGAGGDITVAAAHSATLQNAALDAASVRGTGGAVSVTADAVALSGTTAINASGAGGGGSVRVGGGFHGQDSSLANARQVSIGSAASIDASATEAGAGGTVAVWSDGHTDFAGSIAAHGGSLVGDGGFVEVSGKGTLDFSGQVDAHAAHGAAGTLLLDPTNIIIATGGSTSLAANPLTFATAVGTDSTLDPTAITNVTNTGTAVSLQASNDLTINSAIQTSHAGAGGDLTFRAGHSITVNASVVSDNGNINFTTNDSGANATYRSTATPAAFINNSVIDAGSGTVTILMDTFAGATGTIGTGHIAGANLVVTQNGPTAGAASGAIDLGQSDITGNLTISANSARNVTNTLGDTGTAGNVVVRGTASISVGAGNVSIAGPHTDFNIIGLTAGNVALNDTNAVQFGATNLSGTLTETTLGPIASTGAVQVAGLTTLTANNGGFGIGDPYISLTNTGNHFGGGMVLSVATTGATGTGGYATIRDSGAITINSSNTATSLTVQAGGAITTTGADTAGTSVSLSTSSGAVTTGSTTANYFTVGATGAVSLGASAVGVDLSVSTSGAISDTGPITVGRQTTLTAGSANNITLTNANDDFSSMYIVSANNATLVDKNGINFGAYCGCGGYNSHVYGSLTLTAGGDITQTGQSGGDGYSAITVGGTTTFTANNSSAQINLYLGSTDPFSGNAGESNLFSGGVTLARNNANTGFSNVDLRDTNPSAVVLAGLTSVGTLSNVSLRYDSAPAVALPGMTVTGTLKVYAPSVLNTGTTPANIISQTGPIVVSGATIMAAGSTGDITLANASNNFAQFGIANTGARNFTLVNSGAIVLYAPGYHQYVTNNYSVTAGGDISDVQYNLGVPGEATFNAGTHNITLTGTNFSVNDLAIPAANNVTIYSQNSVVLDNIAITGSLNLASRGGGTLTQLASTSVVTGSPSTNTTTFNTYNSGITLNQAGNVFGKLSISNAGAINIRENDPITQANAWTTWSSNGGNTTRYPVTLTTSNDQAITLDQNNYFGDLTITQINTGATGAGAVLVRENSDSVYGMTQGSAWTVHGTTTLDSGSYSITLNNANNVFGPLQVLGATGSTGTTPVPSTVTLYAKNAATDAISDVGATGFWNTGTGVVKLVAYDSTGATAGAGNITLTNPANVLGDLYIKGAAVTITENASITDGPSTSWDTAGDTGWVTTGATNLVVANPTGKSITLDNLTNNLGPVGINTTGTAGTLTSVLVTDNSNLTQLAVWNVGSAPVTLDARTHQIDLSGYANVLGPITINTANGSPTSVAITENDPITQGSVWPLTGVPVTLVAQNNNAITLTNAANVMGPLTITGGAVSITENGAITQGGAWTTTGTTTLNIAAASGSGIALTNAGNVLGPLAIVGTPNTVSITENDDITQASAWVQASTPFTLNAGSHNIVLSQAGNQLGDLTLTAQNATVTENGAGGITDGGAWTIPGTTTLTAGSANPIVLNANPASDLGTVSIVSASNADINDVNGIIFGASTVAAGGTLTVTAGGAITQSGAITATSLRLIGTGNATLTNAANAVDNLAAGFSGGDLSFTNGGNFAVAVVGGTSGVTIGAHNVSLTSATGTITGLTNVNASSASLTLTTGTALSLPQMTVAGAQTYTASTVSGTGITLNAGLTSTAAGAIRFLSPVALAADLTVQSTNSAINFAGTLAGGTNQLTVNAGTGLATFGGAVTALGSTGDAGAALSLTSSGATFTSTLGANNGLAITGPVVFNDTVTLANGNAASVFTGLVTLGKAGGMNLSGYNGMSFNGGVLLQNGATTINSNNSPLTFQNAAVTGPYALALDSGTAALNGLNFMGTNLTSLTVTALNPTIPTGGISIAGPQAYTATSGSSIHVNGAVTSTASGNITFNSPVSLAAAATVTSSNSPVLFAATVDGNNNLTVNAGSGITTFTGAVGAVAPLGNGTGAAINLQSTGATTFASTVQTRSGITAAGPVTFTGNDTLGNGDTGSVFSGLVTTGGTTGNIITGYDGLAFNGGLNVVGGPVSIASNGSTLAFGGPVTGAQALTLNALAAGAGTITGLAQIGFASNLTSLTLTAQTLSLPSGGLAVAGPMSFTAAGGITVNGAVGNSAAPATGQIDFNGPVILATGPIGVTTHNAAIDFNGTLDGAEALTVNAGTAA